MNVFDVIVESLELDSVTLDDRLDSIVEYDSMGILTLIEVFDMKGIDLSPGDFEFLDSVSDLVSMIESK